MNFQWFSLLEKSALLSDFANYVCNAQMVLRVLHRHSDYFNFNSFNFS